MKFGEHIKTWWETDITKEGKIIEYVHSYQHHCEMRKTSEEFVQSLNQKYKEIKMWISNLKYSKHNNEIDM